MTLFFMIFLHIIADFNFQGCLAQLKQKDWWVKNYPEKLYRNDYKISLIIHSFSWTFLIMLPFIFNLSYAYIFLFSFNLVFHYIIDDLKANRHKISLTMDQLLHLGQIILTFIILD
jgi:hypothetical protein